MSLVNEAIGQWLNCLFHCVGGLKVRSLRKKQGVDARPNEVQASFGGPRQRRYPRTRDMHVQLCLGIGRSAPHRVKSCQGSLLPKPLVQPANLDQWARKECAVRGERMSNGGYRPKYIRGV